MRRLRAWPTPVSPVHTTTMRLAAMEKENERLVFITHELRHRTKNLVSVIQSMARQTMKQAVTSEDFEARFSSRLGALALTLDLLIEDNWHGARIDELVRQQLAPFGAVDGLQISAKGPPVCLNAEAARNIGFALHELATNATKYGALSVPEGNVGVLWQLATGVEGERFHMAWREYGGPIVSEPQRWGFGRQVIQRMTAQSLAGKVTHEFARDGVRWTLDIPAAFVVSNALEET